MFVFVDDVLHSFSENCYAGAAIVSGDFVRESFVRDVLLLVLTIFLRNCRDITLFFNVVNTGFRRSGLQ